MPRSQWRDVASAFIPCQGDEMGFDAPFYGRRQVRGLLVLRSGGKRQWRIHLGTSSRRSAPSITTHTRIWPTSEVGVKAHLFAALLEIVFPFFQGRTEKSEPRLPGSVWRNSRGKCIEIGPHGAAYLRAGCYQRNADQGSHQRILDRGCAVPVSKQEGHQSKHLTLRPSTGIREIQLREESIDIRRNWEDADWKVASSKRACWPEAQPSGCVIWCCWRIAASYRCC